MPIKCPFGGVGGGDAAHRSGEGYAMPLKLSSSYLEDLSKSKIAEMLKGTMKVSGTYQSKLNIICPPAKP
jgi:hypothetical protein